MAILTRSDFDQIIADSISAYPTLTPLYQAKDPRILQPLNAMATMLSMFSAQVEVSILESFKKTRNGIILADAAMRGIVRKSEPAKAVITVFNGNKTDFILDDNRVISDSTGKSWLIDAGKIIPSGTGADISITQVIIERVTHRVTESMPFYAIPITKSSDDTLFLSSINLQDSKGEWQYRDRYVNALPENRIYHVESDERERIFIRFGVKDVVGVQPVAGDEFTIIIGWTHGYAAMPQADSPFSFEYISTPNDMMIKMSMSSMILNGKDPMPMRVLRDLAHYPSTYDHNAVFLGEFDFLIRRHYPEMSFISVWNEGVEELIRGSSVDHINRLFVSVSDGYDINDLTVETTTESQFSYINPNTYTAKQLEIIETIAQADTSYRVRFIKPVIRHVYIEIIASVSKVFSLDIVREQIKNEILAEYGVSGIQHGKRYQTISTIGIHDLLRLNVQALINEQADLRVVMLDSSLKNKPEAWYMVTEQSLSITVEHSQSLVLGWR